jgi:hypothetical protein
MSRENKQRACASRRTRSRQVLPGDGLKTTDELVKLQHRQEHKNWAAQNLSERNLQIWQWGLKSNEQWASWWAKCGTGRVHEEKSSIVGRRQESKPISRMRNKTSSVGPKNKSSGELLKNELTSAEEACSSPQPSRTRTMNRSQGAQIWEPRNWWRDRKAARRADWAGKQTLSPRANPHGYNQIPAQVTPQQLNSTNGRPNSDTTKRKNLIELLQENSFCTTTKDTSYRNTPHTHMCKKEMANRPAIDWERGTTNGAQPKTCSPISEKTKRGNEKLKPGTRTTSP